MIARAAAGALLAALIAGAAWSAGALAPSGAVAAVVIGTLATAAGWSWAVLVIAFFVSSVLLSRVGAARKAARTAAIVEKGGARDAAQVLANGAPFAVAALAWLFTADPMWFAAAAGALAAAAADTWGTEIGTLAGGRPRLVLGWRSVPAGTSGAVSAAGVLATVAGAAFLATVAWAFARDGMLWMAVAAGGVAGAAADTLLGAAAQERRWCDRCDAFTERALHDCGARTRTAGGIPRLDNDLVNLVCSIVGAAVAGVLA